MKQFLYILLLLIPLVGSSQDELNIAIDETVDDRYLEDQFYIGLTYNILLDRPPGVTQNNLPFGIQFGYIKDIPINKRRNKGLGIGVGYNYNAYFNNLQAIEQDGDIIYQLISDETQFNRNRIGTHVLEIPIEFRWRTSKAVDYKFWRIYGGVRFGYVFANSSRFVSDAENISFTNDDIERLQYDLYFSFGYNTWNFYASYALNNLLRSDVFTIEGDRIDMNALKIGLIFYLL